MDRDADALFGLPRDEFIARRGELAKAMRKEGRREDAAAVAALRKPSVAAWAVNQLVRTQRSSVQELLDAGDALRDAQTDLLAGQGDGRTLRAAGDRERAAVEDLVDRARGLLSSAGDELSPAVIERVADTLHAVALDEAARDQVGDGRLERELRHAGLGLGLGESGLIAPEPRRPRARPADASSTQAAEGEGQDASKPDDAGQPSESAAATRAAAKPKREPADTKRGEAVREGGTAATKRGKAAPDDEPRQTKRERERAEKERAAAERAAAEQERRERAAAVKAARAAEVATKRRADVAARALAAAEAVRDEAAQALSAAEVALDAARENASSTAAAHTRAHAEREDAELRRRG